MLLTKGTMPNLVQFVGKNCRGDKLRADNRDNVLLARIDGTVAVAKNKEVDKEIELSNDEGKSRMALFHGNLTPKSVARRGKLLGILPQIKQKMLFECTFKKDKYKPQKDWVNFSKYVSRYCRSAKQTDLWKMSSSRKAVGFPNYVRFTALTKNQSLCLKKKVANIAEEMENLKLIKKYYEI